MDNHIVVYPVNEILLSSVKKQVTDKYRFISKISREVKEAKHRLQADNSIYIKS